MGRVIIFVVFIIGFIVFAVIKSIIVGSKAAYNAVFDPHSKDEKIKILINDCMLQVSHAMYENYNRKPGELLVAIIHLTPIIQSKIMDSGYQVNSAVARDIVCNAIVVGGHATWEEIDRA